MNGGCKHRKLANSVEIELTAAANFVPFDLAACRHETSRVFKDENLHREISAKGRVLHRNLHSSQNTLHLTRMTQQRPAGLCLILLPISKHKVSNANPHT